MRRSLRTAARLAFAALRSARRAVACARFCSFLAARSAVRSPDCLTRSAIRSAFTQGQMSL